MSADFDSIQANVFTPICSVCHIGADAPQGLILDAEHSYNLLVNVPSTEVPSILRVDPGSPDNSYIIQKLEGHAAVGGQMPLGETPLPASTIAFIAQWITDGAQPSAAATAMATAADFRIAAVSPEDGDLLPVAPSQLVIGFTRELDATRIDAQSVRLERIGSAGDAPETLPMAIRVSVPAANARALLVTPLTTLRSGQYRLVLSGGSGAEVSALDGSRLASPIADANGERLVARFAVAEAHAAETP